jgi:hypothetical protein
VPEKTNLASRSDQWYFRDGLGWRPFLALNLAPGETALALVSFESGWSAADFSLAWDDDGPATSPVLMLRLFRMAIGDSFCLNEIEDAFLVHFELSADLSGGQLATGHHYTDGLR